MSHDIVRQKTTAKGFGPYPMIADPGWILFSAHYAPGDVIHIALQGVDAKGSQLPSRSVGTGTLTIDGRMQVLSTVASSNNNQPVDFQGAAIVIVDVMSAGSVRDLIAAMTLSFIDEAEAAAVTSTAITDHVQTSDPHGDRAWFSTQSYLHDQVSVSSTWVINHNLGFTPIVATFNVGGVEIEGNVIHMSVNQVQVSFAVPLAGTARLT